MTNFDFEVEESSGALIGDATLPRDYSDLNIWKKTPYDAAHALCDLHMKANTDSGEHTLSGGLKVAYQAGWLLWSNVALAERWGWRRENVEKFLQELEKHEVIRREDIGQGRKAIILLEFRNPFAQPTGQPFAQPNVQPLDTDRDRDQSLEIETEGKQPTNFPDMSAAIAYFTDNDSGYAIEEIKSAWHELTAGAVDGCWMIGRPSRPVADWRSALESELWKRRQIFGQKNSARGPEPRRADEVPLPQKNSALTLEAMMGVVP